jgi:formylglycine-generating enzyme required for sulfatase activity
VVVPAGTFMMGSPKGEQEFGLDYDEGPQHSVTIVRQFAVGRFAVTFDEWDACAADGGCNGFRPADHSGRGRQPVIEVSWDDAQAYLQWLSRKTGKAYRLLSEAEREYVTRAGTTTPYWWGTSISPSQANHGEGGETVPVDSFEPNPWGLYQVHGNISEWVEDCYRDSYTGAPSNGSAWTSGDCSYQVIRGGGFRRYNSARAAARGRHTTVNRVADDRMGGTEFVVNRDRNIGFRVARMLTP